MGKPIDLKFDFDEIWIPSVQRMLEKEEQHLTYLKTFIGKVPDSIINRYIDSSMESARLYRQRIQEYKEYSSNL